MTDPLAYSGRVLTRAEMEAEHGAPPARHVTTWAINRAHATVTYITDDGGEHWVKKRVVWVTERARRDGLFYREESC